MKRLNAYNRLNQLRYSIIAVCKIFLNHSKPKEAYEFTNSALPTSTTALFVKNQKGDYVGFSLSEGMVALFRPRCTNTRSGETEFSF